jgi:hypothetical protein
MMKESTPGAEAPARTETRAERRGPVMNWRAIPKEALNILEVVAYAIGWLGIILIAYGIISTLTSEVWAPLERFILPIAATLVLLTTLLNAAAVYLVQQPPAAPAAVSRYVTGPAIILLCLVAVVMVWWQSLPVSVILGIAILGLTWSLLRVLPRQTASW